MVQVVKDLGNYLSPFREWQSYSSSRDDQTSNLQLQTNFRRKDDHKTLQGSRTYDVMILTPVPSVNTVF